MTSFAVPVLIKSNQRFPSNGNSKYLSFKTAFLKSDCEGTSKDVRFGSPALSRTLFR